MLIINFIRRKVKKIASFFGIVFLFLIITPFVSFAVTTLGEIEVAVLEVFNKIPPLLIGLAVVFFLWSVVKFIKSGDNEDARAQGKALMAYGIIAIFVMVSLWGLIGILRNTFDIEDEKQSNTPDILTPS